MTSKTIALTGTEIEVSGLNGANAHIRNDGSSRIYASRTSGVSAGADDVIVIPPGQSASVRGIAGRVFLLGKGSVYIQSDDYAANPFAVSPDGGAGGSGSSAVSADCELIRCETRHAEEAEVIDVSGAKYFGIRPTSAVGVSVALLSGGTHQNEELVYVPSAGGCLIREVPASGNIFVEQMNVTYVLYTSDSYSAIENACRISLVGWTDIRKETT